MVVKGFSLIMNSNLLAHEAFPIPKYFYLLRAFCMLKTPLLSNYSKQRLMHFFANKNSTKTKHWQNYSYVVRNNNVTYCGTLGNYIDWFAFFFGGDERCLLDCIYLPILESLSSPVYIDVGGNIGHHAVYLSAAATQIHSFEPVPSCLAEFKRKIKAAGITNCTLHEFALGERIEEAIIHCSITYNGGTNSFLKQHDAGNSQPITVNIFPFDSLTDLNINSIDLVKVDVEGFEPSVLIGMRHSLRVHRPFVICELSESSNRQLHEKQISFASLFPDDYLFVDADTIATKKIIWSYDWLKHYSIPGSFKGNVLSLPLERINRITS
jgi:FkbM family methyltransferase